MDERTGRQPALRPSSPAGVMILGSGACARRIAARLSACGIDAWMTPGGGSSASPAGDATGKGVPDVELLDCRGAAGRFDLQLRTGGETVRRSVSAIVVAEEARPSPTFAAYGLTFGDRVVDISTFESKLPPAADGHPLADGASVAFLCGWANDSHPTVAKRMLDGCLQQQQAGAATYFLTGNLKVAEAGAEARVQEAKRAGTVFLKFSRDYPAVTPLAGERFEVTGTDELTGAPFRLTVDWIVVDEAIEPARCLADLARILRIDRNGVGFAQSDNVRRLSNATNRRGIFVAGGGRGGFSAADLILEADRAASQVVAFLHGRDADPRPAAAIQDGRCARCLTCYRLCPHGAVAIGAPMTIADAACQRCGICVAGCPAGAIEMPCVPTDRTLPSRSEQADAAVVHQRRHPRIVIFGCARSAAPALADGPLPEGVRFVEVPCGGAVGDRDLLAAIDAGAEGVMLYTCHTDNCQSEIGNRLAGRRAESVKRALTVAGWDDRRLRVQSVAANMRAVAAETIAAFAEQIRVLSSS